MDDAAQIRNLTARYNHALDDGDIAGWLGCWTQDGYFERFESRPRACGHEELAEMARTFPIRGRHFVTDHVVDVVGDSATQRCSLLYLDRSTGKIKMFGEYRDTLIRTESGWQFQTRIFRPDYLDPTTD